MTEYSKDIEVLEDVLGCVSTDDFPVKYSTEEWVKSLQQAIADRKMLDDAKRELPDFKKFTDGFFTWRGKNTFTETEEGELRIGEQNQKDLVFCLKDTLVPIVAKLKQELKSLEVYKVKAEQSIQTLEQFLDNNNNYKLYVAGLFRCKKLEDELAEAKEERDEYRKANPNVQHLHIKIKEQQEEIDKYRGIGLDGKTDYERLEAENKQLKQTVKEYVEEVPKLEAEIKRLKGYERRHSELMNIPIKEAHDG